MQLQLNKNLLVLTQPSLNTTKDLTQMVHLAEYPLSFFTNLNSWSVIKKTLLYLFNPVPLKYY